MSPKSDEAFHRAAKFDVGDLQLNIFKTALLGASLLVAGSVAASAADVYERGGSYKDEVAYAPAITWTGFYIGAHAGSTFDSEVEVQGEGSADIDDAFIAGVHVGYNWQRPNNVVLGLEGSLSFVDDDFEGEDVTDYVGTVRGRLGYAFDRTLVYATGGLAVIGYDTDEVDDAVGYVVGAGIEHKITNRISLGLEALYYDVNTDFEDLDVDQNMWSVQARLNFHLGSHDEPLK
jgi:outer membrane immunogenic protein